MLGRAVMGRFAAERDWEVAGLCHTRAGDGLTRADLADPAARDAALARLAPDVVVHAAAIREPDAFAADVAAARRLNVDATAALARWAAAAPGRFLVYISSDYVFDGSAPPYRPDSPTHAVNAYGLSKLDGEVAVRAAAADRSAVLRVPVLYGDVETLRESSVTTVFAQVLGLLRPDAPRALVLDDWATRYPTHVADVAEVLAQIVRRRLAGTFHWSGPEPLTKLEMGRAAAGLLGVDAARLVGSGAPANGSEPRPRDCHLDRSLLEGLGVSTADTPFAAAAARLAARFGPPRA